MGKRSALVHADNVRNKVTHHRINGRMRMGRGGAVRDGSLAGLDCQELLSGNTDCVGKQYIGSAASVGAVSRGQAIRTNRPAVKAALLLHHRDPSPA